MTEQLTERTAVLAPIEVREFVTSVREHLVDLDKDEQQELTADLEADLTDLVAERGADALGDPAAYAQDLRSAAGHTPSMDRRTGGRHLRTVAMETIDTAHDTWDRFLDSVSGDLRGFLTAIQPAWWVLRAWAAWMVAQDVRGPNVLIDGPWLGVLVAFVIVSIQVGRHEWGLGRLLTRSVLIRLLLVGLNVFAVTMIPGAADRLSLYVAEQHAWELGWDQGGGEVEPNPDTIVYQGGQACELEVRDARGQVIPDAHVWDLTGNRPLPMSTELC
jgi:hypothetical protein